MKPTSGIGAIIVLYFSEINKTLNYLMIIPGIYVKKSGIQAVLHFQDISYIFRE
jgi:hypothetical protein